MKIWACTLLSIAVSFIANATPKEASLRYTVEEGVLNCPDALWVRQSVSARLGFNPFRDDADTQIEVDMRKGALGLEAQLAISHREKGTFGKRNFFSKTGDCLELSSALELAIAVAIDPTHLTRPATPPAEPPMSAARPAAPPPGRSTPAETSFLWQARLGLLGSGGLSPSIAPGTALQVTARFSRFSLGLEGRLDFPTTLELPGGTVGSSTLLGAIIPCFHFGPIGTCGVVSAGAIQVTGEVATSTRKSSPLLLTGARIQYEFSMFQTLNLTPYLDVQAVLTRTRIVSENSTLWVTSPLATSAGLLLGISFL